MASALARTIGIAEAVLVILGDALVDYRPAVGTDIQQLKSVTHYGA